MKNVIVVGITVKMSAAIPTIQRYATDAFQIYLGLVKYDILLNQPPLLES